MPSTSKATIRDVARACGLSPGTVSNVLNSRKGRVSSETRDRVLEAVRRLQYRPSASAGDLEGIVRNIGVVMYAAQEQPIIGVPYFALVVDGLLRGTGDAQWSTTFFVESMWEDAERGIREFCDGRCSGIIVVSPSRECSIVQALQSRGVTVVAVGGGNMQFGASTVDVDNEEGGYRATRHLISLGHRHIVHLTGSLGNHSAHEREAGYRCALAQSGLEPIVLEGAFTFDAGQSLAERWRRDYGSQGATALVTGNDEAARGFIDTALAYGLRIPDDVSVIGFDDYPNAPRAAVPLTSIRVPLQQIGRRAVRVVVDAAVTRMPARETIRFPAELIVRESSAPPKQRSFLPKTNEGSSCNAKHSLSSSS
jgi:LacI family transcriptional regulator